MAWTLAPELDRWPRHQWQLPFLMEMSPNSFRSWLRGRREALNQAMREWKDDMMVEQKIEKVKMDYEDIFQWIIDYKAEHDGNSPTIREIMKGTGVKSTSHMVWILDRLVELGQVYRKDGKLCIKNPRISADKNI